jgi:hypothetical protein
MHAHVHVEVNMSIRIHFHQGQWLESSKNLIISRLISARFDLQLPKTAKLNHIHLPLNPLSTFLSLR